MFIEYPKRSLEFQRLLGDIFMLVDQFCVKHGLGEVLFAPLDVLIQKIPLRTRQPDILFVSNRRVYILHHDIVRGGPDLVIEILSLGANRISIKDKLSDYAKIDVKECWLVSPDGMTVEVLVQEKGNWSRLALLGSGDNMKSNVLEGFDVEVSRLFKR